MTRRGWLVAVAGVLLLAAVLRLVGLDRWPPGLHYDEAAYGLQGLELWQHPRLAVFFPAFTGREPLYIYLLAGAIGLLGPSVFTIRLVAALVGVAAVATTAICGRALVGRGAGLLGAGLLAASFWHVTISRMTYRAGLVAALGPLAIWLLWRLWERPSALRGLLAGAAIGLLAYTYVAIRLLPVALALFVVSEVVAGLWRRSRGTACVDKDVAPGYEGRLLRAGLIGLAVAVLVVAPLAAYFVRHPADFGVRFSQTVALGAGDETPGARLVDGVVATLGMYGVRGDVLQKYNLPLRPALDPVLALMFVVGMLGLLWRIADARARLLLCWLLGTLAPGFITADSPNFLRLIGAAPPSYLIAAYGALVFAGLASRVAGGSPLPLGEGQGEGVPGVGRRRPLPRAAAMVATVALVAVEAGFTADAYFRDWARSADTYYALHGDLADLGRLAALLPPDATAYAASEHYKHPTVAYTAGPAFERLRWFDGRDALVLPPPGGAAAYLVPRSARPPDVGVLGTPVEARRDPGGESAVELYRPPPTTSAAPTAAGAVFVRRADNRPLAELLEVAPPSSARAGETARVRTVWRLRASSPGASLDLFAHAVDAGGRRWGQRDASPYLTSEWREGETLIAWLDVPIDPTAPPGQYRIRVGLNDPASPGALEPRRPGGVPIPEVLSPPIPVAHAAGPPAPEALTRATRAFGSVASAAGPAAATPQPSDGGAAPAGGRLPAELGSVELPAASVPGRLAVGESAWIDLLWRARADAPAGAAELVLRGEGGERSLGSRELASIDSGVAWRAGEVLRDARRFAPRRADAGRWTLVLRLSGAGGGQELLLGSVEVTLPAATFDLPSPQVRRDDPFESVARLLGLDLAPDHVRLYWQALEPPETRYSVFVHVLARDGRILAQHDGQPVGGARPTTGWIPDEVIADDHPLAFPPDWTSLSIGLYDPASGQRLRLPGGADHVEVARP